MICPICQYIQQSSTVEASMVIKTTMPVKHFYATDGLEHVHNYNADTTVYICSLDHAFWYISRPKCPQGDFGGEGEMLMTMVPFVPGFGYITATAT